MIDRPAGSFIDDGSGVLKPDLNDPAMAARAAIETKKEEHDNAQN